ncbi:lipocalin-like domain-containing protein [Noviherbaspirillum pedocola]|uniref:Carotenoid 1,2-hydratase n=1 Tax=Noviherbaspirillum pedocola TaxID=2801341 RepID=A0A934SY82_9BURK|nr:carotenoid 1,2-hydratase [Noviherbaspirillum pedocola]MBK4737510.1 carotenoid 1,2-hydratase [Noviherbaspirillum pedocola]
MRKLLLLLLGCVALLAITATAAPPRFAEVKPEDALVFPRDFGAHPDYRTEWWYATGWLQTPDGKQLGFQLTFFRAATEHDRDNPSSFAPKQLIIAHAALSDPTIGRLLHDQKAARSGFDLAYAKTDNTDVKLQDWRFVRDEKGVYHANIPATDFTLTLDLAPTQPIMPQGEGGYSRKGPLPGQASHYFSEPQLKVSGSVSRNGKPVAVTGTAWLDREWSTSYLAPGASGWDWMGINLDDGSALMAFRIRAKDGSTLWSHATLRDAAGRMTQFAQQDIRFTPLRNWRSPHTDASYPVAIALDTGGIRWTLEPLQDDQELDSRASTGSVYWEGAVRVTRDGKPAGRGYLELTGYVSPLKL